MRDLIDRQLAIEAHYEYCNKHPDAGFPVWSLKILEDLPSAQTEPCECAVSAIAVEEMLKDLLPARGMWEIEGDDAKNAICETVHDALEGLWKLPFVKPDSKESSSTRKALDTISRRETIDALDALCDRECEYSKKQRSVMCGACHLGSAFDVVEQLPSAQSDRDKAKRVLWTGWKGHRDTRYKCPNCNKPVRNDDVFCHRCGQKLMFPQISWTPYVEGQKQELIVRWDDE